MHCPELRASLPPKTPASPGNSPPEITGAHTRIEGKSGKKNRFGDNNFSPNLSSPPQTPSILCYSHLVPQLSGQWLYPVCGTLYPPSEERTAFVRFILGACSLNLLTPMDKKFKTQLKTSFLQPLLDIRKQPLILYLPHPNIPCKNNLTFLISYARKLVFGCRGALRNAGTSFKEGIHNSYTTSGKEKPQSFRTSAK